MRIEPDRIRDELNEHLKGAPKGEAQKIAHAAEISPSTLSRFRAGIYPGRSDLIAAKLAEALESRIIGDEIASGKMQQFGWIVITGNRLRAVKKMQTVEELVGKNPAASVIQVWGATESGRVHFVKVLKG
jgi:hypothetical protein